MAGQVVKMTDSPLPVTPSPKSWSLSLGASEESANDIGKRIGENEAPAEDGMDALIPMMTKDLVLNPDYVARLKNGSCNTCSRSGNISDRTGAISLEKATTFSFPDLYLI
ncbi:unnamed protein product [Lepeophtheirus salmonis]|uniref:(salmon louse) hypothetical protein n=1 Tax=Lepeophtheirus salmonis TaxID=72036 RepID=A0A7R8CTL5_LEPSM|nr:unnamed protein product [Lepeophtheirus salmonis]CAF2925899.1 unnamed protein product [Lepeophtheirus salmonis]